MEQNIIIQTIIRLLKEQNKSQKSLTDYLGITQNAFTDWKSGRIKSYNKHLPQIADFFGVSVDYLLGNTDEAQKESDKKPNSVIRNVLSPQEMALINAYRSQPELQVAVDRLLGIEQKGDVYVYNAAQSEDKRPDTVTRIAKEDWEKIKNAPNTDNTLL